MASIIPKISVGLSPRKKSKLNLSFDCSTTANIGAIQPTMCREMVPDEKFKVKQSSIVRLYPMPVPTFGRMSLRNYHVYVPYIDLWEPFDSFLSGQHYTANSTSFVPTAVPTFYPEDVAFRYIMSYSDISIAPVEDMDHPYTITTSNVCWDGTVIEFGSGTHIDPDDPDSPEKTYSDAVLEAQAHDLALIKTAYRNLRNQGPRVFGRVGNVQSFFGTVDPSVPGSLSDPEGKGVLNLGFFHGCLRGVDDASSLTIAYPGVSGGNIFGSTSDSAPITAEGADLITTVDTVSGKSYYVFFKFKSPLKRLRQVMIGLGYGFHPYQPIGSNASYTDTKQNLFKLLAYYKAWYSLFRPNRQLSWQDTQCYRFIKHSATLTSQHFNTSDSIFAAFLDELFRDCYYYLPMDYFSMSVVKPQAQQSEAAVTLTGGLGYAAGDNQKHINTTVDDMVHVRNAGDNQTNVNPVVGLGSTSAAQNPLLMKMAFKLLTWANKNTVLGRSVRDYLRVHYGVTDTMSIDQDGVYRIGSSRINVSISDVISTSETGEGTLGEYAGKGIGYGDSETFDFTAPKFGVWLTLTVIVPESGYYQGYLRENRQQTRFDFFDSSFDALGYQTLERGEIMNDWNCDSGTAVSTGDVWNPSRDFAPTVAFGFVPRYSHLKVGRNIVNGDLSLAGMYNSMAPYTLDRRFSAGVIRSNQLNSDGTVYKTIGKPSYVPTVVFDEFRKIDASDSYGQYNRVFFYQNNDIDHFIIHSVFDVTAYAPMKPLSESFDTISPDDDGSADISHS